MPKTYFRKISAWAYNVYVSFKNKRIPLFVWFIWGLLVFSAVDSLFQELYSATFVSVLTLLLTFVPYLFQRRYKLYIPSSVISLITLFLYAAIFLGEVQNFYIKFWWWDVILHAGSAVGFGLIGLVILLLLYEQSQVKGNPFVFSIFVFTFALALGAMWEIFEFTMDQLFGLRMQKNGLVDTMWDLIVDGVGALFASFIGYLFIKGKQIPGFGHFGSFIEKTTKNNDNP